MGTPPGVDAGLRVDIHSGHVSRPLRRGGDRALPMPAEGACVAGRVPQGEPTGPEAPPPRPKSHASSVQGPSAPPARLCFFRNQMSVFKIPENTSEAIKKVKVQMQSAENAPGLDLHEVEGAGPRASPADAGSSPDSLSGEL